MTAIWFSDALKLCLDDIAEAMLHPERTRDEARRISTDDAYELAESPIEVELLDELVSMHMPRFAVSPFDKVRSVLEDDGLYVYPQMKVGRYRLDFLLTRKSAPSFLAIECDGFDFHRKHQWQIDRDRARDADLAANRIFVRRISGASIRNEVGLALASALFESGLYDDDREVTSRLKALMRAECCHRGAAA